ncbi:MAG: alanine/ornithine racemase family PLP-dependent enzyme [Nitrospirota bacterium]|nr:MAG: alanine/ornithine racemase family PLP-dependent enzyme [Nitrospirota bacterium]
MPVLVGVQPAGTLPAFWYAHCANPKPNRNALAYPYLTIDLSKIQHNARTIVNLCRSHDIEVTGVTKATCGNPDVAMAMLRGGVSSIGESRMENIHRLKAAGIQTSFMLLRVPPLSGVEEVVKTVDLSLNSELSVLRALSQAAQGSGHKHDVILMVELGDLREGIPPEDLLEFMREASELPNIRIKGLGTNLACFGGVVPNEGHMNRLAGLAKEVEEKLGLQLPLISGLNSSGLELIGSKEMSGKINHARIGEAILLGRETIHRRPWPGTYQDAFLLHAEILELKKKPSMPIVERGEDAFGGLPTFKDDGDIERALLNVGREDVTVEGLTPLDSGVTILGGSSGYLVVDVSRAKGSYRVGEELSFLLNYSALLRASTSEYVKKRPVNEMLPKES